MWIIEDNSSKVRTLCVLDKMRRSSVCRLLLIMIVLAERMWHVKSERYNGQNFSGSLQGHFEKCENAIILAFKFLKYWFLSSLLSILQWIFTFYNSQSLCYKGNMPNIRNLPGNSEQYDFLLDSSLSCKPEISFRKLSGEFFWYQNIFHLTIFILVLNLTQVN